MEPNDTWLWYCAQRLGNPEPFPDPEVISPAQALELLWDFHPLFTPRSDAIKATPYSQAFDQEADGALEALARSDNFDSWERLSAGAWRVLMDRLTYSEAVAAINKGVGNPIMTRVPVGLDRPSKARALLLLLLLNEGRTIDPRWLAQKEASALRDIPATSPLRRQ